MSNNAPTTAKGLQKQTTVVASILWQSITNHRPPATSHQSLMVRRFRVYNVLFLLFTYWTLWLFIYSFSFSFSFILGFIIVHMFTRIFAYFHACCQCAPFSSLPSPCAALCQQVFLWVDSSMTAESDGDSVTQANAGWRFVMLAELWFVHRPHRCCVVQCALS